MREDGQAAGDHMGAQALVAAPVGVAGAVMGLEPQRVAVEQGDQAGGHLQHLGRRRAQSLQGIVLPDREQPQAVEHSQSQVFVPWQGGSGHAA